VIKTAAGQRPFIGRAKALYDSRRTIAMKGDRTGFDPRNELMARGIISGR
jgi:hypothetical protein